MCIKIRRRSETIGGTLQKLNYQESSISQIWETKPEKPGRIKTSEKNNWKLLGKKLFDKKSPKKVLGLLIGLHFFFYLNVCFRVRCRAH